MKKHVLALSYLCITFFFAACYVEHLCHLEIVMRNTLPMHITIKTKSHLVNSSDSLFYPIRTIEILANEEHSEILNYRYEIVYPQYFDANCCDTMWVVFNDSVSVVYTKYDNSVFNPILIENYESLPTQNSWDGCLQYTFTEKDYQNALVQCGYRK